MHFINIIYANDMESCKFGEGKLENSFSIDDDAYDMPNN